MISKEGHHLWWPRLLVEASRRHEGRDNIIQPQDHNRRKWGERQASERKRGHKQQSRQRVPTASGFAFVPQPYRFLGR